jgi:hypothetical protein
MSTRLNIIGHWWSEVQMFPDSTPKMGGHFAAGFWVGGMAIRPGKNAR